MSIIIPAILPKSRADLDATLARFAPLAQIETIQIDIVDGVFAKPPTWPYADHAPWELPLTERFRYELDLMVEDPDRSIERWVKLGAARITLHAESTTALKRSIDHFKTRFGHEPGFTPGLLSLGLALGMATPLSVIEPFVSEVDYVQLMGIAHIGRQGEPFDARVLSKIRTLRASHPDLAIHIDGGVSLKTAPKLIAAGATRLIVGSALLHAADLGEAIERFESFGQSFST